MSGAEGVLVVNIAVACLFAGGYAIIALANASQRAALGFSVSYLLGMVAPITDFLAPFLGGPIWLEALGYVCFLSATLSISATFSRFHGRRPPWALILAILVGGLTARTAIWNLPRDTLTYGMAYQIPFTLASILATRTVLSVSARRPLNLGLAAIFAVVAAHFLVKPFLALTFGLGRTFGDYAKTTYALFSQAGTGVLLLAAGLVLLLIVAQKAITEQQQASETDPLSGAANRRGFDRLAQDVLARAARSGLPVSVAMFDLDRFKRVNDTFGHAVGDAVIAAFAGVLRAAAPSAAVIGRQGGEEFVMLIEGATAESAWLAAEAIRVRTGQGIGADLPAMTVSGGVAQLREGESLGELLRRTDQATYQAKNGGRDRICLAQASADPASNVVPLEAWPAAEAASASRRA